MHILALSASRAPAPLLSYVLPLLLLAPRKWIYTEDYVRARIEAGRKLQRLFVSSSVFLLLFSSEPYCTAVYVYVCVCLCVCVYTCIYMFTGRFHFQISAAPLSKLLCTINICVSRGCTHMRAHTCVCVWVRIREVRGASDTREPRLPFAFRRPATF